MEPALISLKLIRPNPYQPRRAEDPAVVAEIAVNIHRNGLLQTPAARAVDGHYELAFGHTRRAAFELLATKGVPDAGIKRDSNYSVMPLVIRELTDRQMFEMAVAENVKRRDLDPIEQARAMSTYMQEFQATSKEAGELFGLNDATVRGKVRLLELPPEAQEKLSQGAISEGTARALLSMGKLTGPDEVVKAVAAIEENDDTLPEATIVNAMERHKDVVVMWRSYDKGEPRGGYKLWLLSMKNFPNELLPAVNVHDPLDLRAHLENPPACTACPFYTAVKGAHFCGLKACHARKKIAWRAYLIEQCSKQLGIPVYDPVDGKYLVLSYDSGHKKAFEKRQAGLRLIQKDQVKGYHYQYGYEGLDDDLLLTVATGDLYARLKAIKKDARAEERATQTAEQRKRDLFHQGRKMLTWEAAGQVAALFASLNEDALGVWRENHPLLYSTDTDEFKPAGRPDKDTMADFTRRRLAFKMLDWAGDWKVREKWRACADCAAWLVEKCNRWGVELPRSIQEMAAQFDAEIAAVVVEKPQKKSKKAQPVAEGGNMKQAFLDKNFNAKSLDLIAQANKIIDEYAAMGYKLTLRQLYYQLVTKNAIANTQREYKNLGNLLNNARLAGLVDWEAIEDRNRETLRANTWSSPGEIMSAVARQYREDLWREQPVWLEVMAEKNAVTNIIEPVTRRLGVAYTANKGYPSASLLYEMAQRIRIARRQGKQVKVLYFGDHDPSGLDMDRDLTDRLRLLAQDARVELERVALTWEQIELWAPPPNPAKTSDARYAGYEAEHGESSWELDAVKAEDLARLVQDHIEEHIEWDLWREAKADQDEHRARLARIASTIDAEEGDT